MIYYKKIEIDNFEVITQKTLEFIQSKDNINRVGFYWLPWTEYSEYCPEILTAFSRYGLEPIGAATITFNTYKPSIHIDDVFHECRINLPVLNCEGSATEFYEGGEFIAAHTVEKKSPYYVLDPTSSPVKVDEVEIIQPTVIRVRAPHCVRTNPETLPRISLSVAFTVDPVFLLD